MNTESKHSDSQQHGAGEAAEQSPPQEDLQKVHADLEARFVKLSSELSKTVDLLKDEIAARQQAEKAVRASQDRYKELFESTHDIVYTCDTSGKLTSFNKTAERVTGYAREEALQMKIGDLVAPAYRESLALMMNPPRSQEAPAIYQIGLMTKDGRRVPVRISPRLICWEENPIGVLAVGHEIAWSEHGKEPQRTPSADLVIRLEQETAELTRANGQLREQIARHEQSEETLRNNIAEIQRAVEERSSELFEARSILKEHVAALEKAEDELKRTAQEFEVRLAERTGELSKANASLRERVAAHEQTEQALHRTVSELELWVEERSSELARVSEALKNESAAREALEEQLKNVSSESETRLVDRTGELSKANAMLREQIAGHEQTEEALRKALRDLEALFATQRAEAAQTKDSLKEEAALRERLEGELKRERAELDARVLQLGRVEDRLRNETLARQRAEEELKRFETEVEARLVERIGELSGLNTKLREQMAGHERAEQELRNTTAGLESLVEAQQAELARSKGLLEEETGKRTQLEKEIEKAASASGARLEEKTAELSRNCEMLKEQIAAREQTEESLRKSHSELQALLEERTAELAKVKAVLKEEVEALANAEQRLERSEQQVEAPQAEPELHTRELLLLSELGNLLRSCSTADEAYQVIARAAPNLFPNLVGDLFVVSPWRNLMGAVAHWGKVVPDQRTFSLADCWALRTGRVHWVENTHAALLCRHLRKPVPEAYVCVPMIATGEVLGLLHLTQSEEGALTPATRRFAATVAEYIAMALVHLKQPGTPRLQSLCDTLTGLFNRRYLADFLELELDRSLKSRRPLGIIMLDVDNFSAFNDTFGQEAGDALLRELGRFLQSNIREGDIACRYGGGVFGLVLPGGSLEVTQQRAELMREGVKHLVVSHRGELVGQVSVSIGVAAFPEHGRSEAALVRAAEAALYEAKKEGRDRVVVAQ